MSLSRSMAYRIVALTAALVLLALVPLYALHQLRLAVRHAYDEYKELRIVDATAVHLAAAQALMQVDRVDPDAVQRELVQARSAINTFLQFQKQQPRDVPQHEDAEYQTATLTQRAIDALRTHVAEHGADAADPHVRADLLPGARAATTALHELAGHMAAEIDRNYQRLLERLETSILLTGVVALAIAAAIIVINRSLYRSIVQPLRRLRQGVRGIIAGNFSERLQLAGHGEFSEVADDFNQMAAELDSLYRELEEKVRRKSRELVRSERLASVGYLAAGVAHEINNPLNVISGYAELSLRRLDNGEPAETADSVRPADFRKTLEIIRDESFRCKQITEKLLSLSRSSSEDRAPVDLGRAAADVVGLAQALKACRDRQIHLAVDAEPAVIHANETEIKQVLLNLLLNAVEATEPGRGRIDVRIDRDGAALCLSVADNGCGMPPEVLEHVFEPFFTHRRDPGRPGTGLGLTITHAIVESHGGQIRATSGGVGCGSEFRIEWPI